MKHKGAGAMRSLNAVIRSAREKRLYTSPADFRNTLEAIRQTDPTLRLHWDDGAGEEWACLSNDVRTIMMHTRIGLVFIGGAAANPPPNVIWHTLFLVKAAHYDTDEWYIDLSVLQEDAPEIQWHADAEESIDLCHMSLNDLYFATV